MTKFEARMELMGKRRTLVDKHVSYTQIIFYMWRDAVEEDHWLAVLHTISDVLDFLERNESMFPNYDLHVDQWIALYQVAEERFCMLLDGE